VPFKNTASTTHATANASGNSDTGPASDRDSGQSVGIATEQGNRRGNITKKSATAQVPKATFRQPYNGRSQPADLALADEADSLQHENAVNLAARKQGL